MSSKKKPKTKDIRTFFEKKISTGCEGKVKEEDGSDEDPGSSTESAPIGGAAASQEDPGSSTESAPLGGAAASQGGHFHCFKVKFSRSDRKEYTVNCHQPCTVLEAIKSNKMYKKKIKCADKNIIIQMGKEDKETVIATHFPCTCLSYDVCLILSPQKEKIEEIQDQQHKIIHPREEYVVFFIDREGGEYTKTKTLFRSSAVKKYKTLCVYGEKGMTIEEALKRDGRFIDDLGEFELTDIKDPNVVPVCTETVDNLDLKTFKICLPRNKTKDNEKQQENKDASDNLQSSPKTKSVKDVVKQSGISVGRALKMLSADKTEEIYEMLRKQFPDLKKWMEERFPGDSFEKEFNVRKENFGKIQQSFSEVHRVRKLLKLGESVCKVIVGDICEGTGFVLFDNFILTNAHLFEKCVGGEKLQVGVNVSALFNFEDRDTNPNRFSCKKTFIDFNNELDYAVLELNPEGESSRNIEVPPGLLKNVGPVPPNGEACIIGHPGGGVKKMDPTFIIEIGKRKQAVMAKLYPYKDTFFIMQSVIETLKGKGIEDIMIGGNDVVTYDTSMYHGSSGSPVFDGFYQVFGLHRAGYSYGFPNNEHHMIEYAHPLLMIFRTFVRNLKENGKEELFRRVEEEAKGNEHLERIMEAERADAEEPMEIDGE